MTFKDWYKKQPYGELERIRKELIDLISPNMPAKGKERFYNILLQKIVPKPLEQKAISEYAGEALEFPRDYKPKTPRTKQPTLL